VGFVFPRVGTQKILMKKFLFAMQNTKQRALWAHLDTILPGRDSALALSAPAFSGATCGGMRTVGVICSAR
jgi:hypothetical protein